MKLNESSSGHGVKPSRTIDHMIGFMTAVFLAVGRWTPDRLVQVPENTIFIEVRLWIAGLALLILILSSLTRFEASHTEDTSPIRTASILTIAYIVYMMFTSMWSLDASLALAKVYELALVLVMVMVLTRRLWLTGGARVIDAFWITLILVTGVIASIAIYAIVSGTSLARIAVLGGGPNAFGRMMGLLCLGSLWLWRKYGGAWVWLPVAALSFLLIIMSGSRGATVAWGVSIISFLAISRIRISTKVISLLAAIITIIFVLWYTPYGTSITTVYERRFVQLSFEQQYDSGRSSIYQQAFELGMESPVVGLGLDALEARGTVSYPHNIFLESFSEGGIISVFLLVSFCLALSRVLFRHRYFLDGSTVSAFVLSFVFSQFSGDLFDSRPVFLFALLSATIQVKTTYDEHGLSKASVE